MSRRYVLLIFIISLTAENFASANFPTLNRGWIQEYSCQDTVSESQALYNGRIWRNLYYLVDGNQFLFSNEFINGTVTISGKSFSNVAIKYDAFKDELLTPYEHGKILQLNKELVDSFAFNFNGKHYHFIRIREDKSENPGGYFRVIYSGKSALYLKYIKKINKLSISGESESFYQSERLYLVKNGQFIAVSGKGDLLRAMDDKRDQVKSFIRKNKTKVSEEEPENIVPVIKYYDSLSK